MGDDLERDKLDIERERLAIERERLTIERARMVFEQRFTNRHLGILLTALISMAAIAVSASEILVARYDRDWPEEVNGQALMIRLTGEAANRHIARACGIISSKGRGHLEHPVHVVSRNGGITWPKRVRLRSS